MYYIYMLRCSDNYIYTGITTDLNRRIKEHIEKSKKCAKYTSVHDVLKLEAAFTTCSKSDALKLEYRIKKLKKSDKEKLISNNEFLYSIFDNKLDMGLYRIFEIV